MVISRKIQLLLAGAATAAVWSAPAQAGQIGEPVANLFICELDEGPITVGYEAQQAANEAGGEVAHTYRHVFNGFAIRAAPEAVANMAEKNPNVRTCFQSFYVGVDADAAAYATKGPPGGGGGGGGGGGKPGKDNPPPDQVTDWGVARVGGPVAGTFSARVFVVDSGVDLDHPDLNVNAGLSQSFLSSRGRGNDSADDYYGHGTHVAGIIGAEDNAIGTVGVAPGVEIVSIRVLDKNGSAPDADVLAGLEHIAASSDAQAGDIVNLSLVGDAGSYVIDAGVQAVAAKKLLVVMAAGNGFTVTDGVSPAYLDGTNLYTVSAFKEGDVYSFPSNSGSAVDYAEPGENIFSLDKNGGYTTKSGSSMAAPHLSGILAAAGSVEACGTTSIGTGLYVDPDGSGDPIGVLPGSC